MIREEKAEVGFDNSLPIRKWDEKEDNDKLTFFFPQRTEQELTILH